MMRLNSTYLPIAIILLRFHRANCPCPSPVSATTTSGPAGPGTATAAGAWERIRGPNIEAGTTAGFQIINCDITALLQQILLDKNRQILPLKQFIQRLLFIESQAQGRARTTALHQHHPESGANVIVFHVSNQFFICLSSYLEHGAFLL